MFNRKYLTKMTLLIEVFLLFWGIARASPLRLQVTIELKATFPISLASLPAVGPPETCLLMCSYLSMGVGCGPLWALDIAESWAHFSCSTVSGRHLKHFDFIKCFLSIVTATWGSFNLLWQIRLKCMDCSTLCRSNYVNNHFTMYRGVKIRLELSPKA